MISSKITNALGPAPSPATFARLQWEEDAVALADILTSFDRQNEVWIDSQGGDDANDGSDKANAVATLARAQVLGDAYGESVNYIGVAGSVFREERGLLLSNRSCMTVDGAGHCEATNFLTLVPSGSADWTLVSGSRYSRPMPARVGALRLVGFPTAMFYEASDPADPKIVDAICAGARGWWSWDDATSTLHVDAGTRADRLDWEIVDDDATAGHNRSGVRQSNVSNDLMRVEGWRFHGYGASGPANAAHGIDFSMLDDAIAFIKRCESYYSPTHCIVQSGENAGGTLVIKDCKAGCMTVTRGAEASSGAGSVFNSFSSDGEHSTIIHDCEAVHGSVPRYSWFRLENPQAGMAVLAHTLNGAESGQHSVVRMSLGQNIFGCSQMGVISNIPVVDLRDQASWDQHRGFFYCCDMTGRDLFYRGIGGPASGQLAVNCRYELKPLDLIDRTAGALLNTSVNAVALTAIQCTVVIDLSDFGRKGNNTPDFVLNFGYYNSSGASQDNMPFLLNSDIRYVGVSSEFSAANIRFLDFDGRSTSSHLAGNLLQIEADPRYNTARLYANNTPVSLQGNAYYGLNPSNAADLQGHSEDASGVSLSAPIALGHVPRTGDPLYAAAPATIMEYDGLGRRRSSEAMSSPSIGPIESASRTADAPSDVGSTVALTAAAVLSQIEASSALADPPAYTPTLTAAVLATGDLALSDTLPAGHVWVAEVGGEKVRIDTTVDPAVQARGYDGTTAAAHATGAPVRVFEVQSPAVVALTAAERETLAGVIDARLLDAGDATDLIASIVARIGNTNVDEASLVGLIRADLERAGGSLNTLVDRTGLTADQVWAFATRGLTEEVITDAASRTASQANVATLQTTTDADTKQAEVLAAVATVDGGSGGGGATGATPGTRRVGLDNHLQFLGSVEIIDAAVTTATDWTIEKRGEGVTLADQQSAVAVGGVLDAPTWPADTPLPYGATISYRDGSGLLRAELTYQGPPSIGSVDADSTGTTVSYAAHGDLGPAELGNRALLARTPQGGWKSARILPTPAPSATALEVVEGIELTAGERLFVSGVSYGRRTS